MDLKDALRSLRFSVFATALLTLVFQSKGLRKVHLCTAEVANNEALMMYEVVPKLFKNFPKHAVEVEFGNGRKVDFGTIFTVNDIEKPPVKISWPVERKFERAKSRFALGMFGPDIPTREVCIGEYQWQHWLIIDIPGNKWKKGRVVTEYRAYEPFYINDLHRVFFIVYRQRGKDPLNYTDPYVALNASDDVRGFFSWNEFGCKYDFYEPYAINFLQLNCTGTDPILGYEIPGEDQIDENIRDYFKSIENETKTYDQMVVFTTDATDERRGYFSWNNFCYKYNFYEPYAINFMRLNCTGTDPILGYGKKQIKENVKEYFEDLLNPKAAEKRPKKTMKHNETETLNQTRWVFD